MSTVIFARAVVRSGLYQWDCIRLGVFRPGSVNEGRTRFLFFGFFGSIFFCWLLLVVTDPEDRCRLLVHTAVELRRPRPVLLLFSPAGPLLARWR